MAADFAVSRSISGTARVGSRDAQLAARGIRFTAEGRAATFGRGILQHRSSIRCRTGRLDLVRRCHRKRSTHLGAHDRCRRFRQGTSASTGSCERWAKAGSAWFTKLTMHSSIGASPSRSVVMLPTGIRACRRHCCTKPAASPAWIIPSIVRLLETGQTEQGQGFVVYELIVGETLEVRIRRGDYRSLRRPRSGSRKSPKACTTPTRAASCTATSSRATC